MLYAEKPQEFGFTLTKVYIKNIKNMDFNAVLYLNSQWNGVGFFQTILIDQYGHDVFVNNESFY